jgi:hypothetical protein
MGRTSLICTVIATCAVVVTATCLAGSTQSWVARMGWRYVSYSEGDVSLFLSTEPMVKGADRVYVPDEASWIKGAPTWTRENRSEVLSRLKSVAWNRKLEWQDCECPLMLGEHTVVPGSLESTPGGRALEEQRLFEPGRKVTHAEAHKVWHDAARSSRSRLDGILRSTLKTENRAQQELAISFSTQSSPILTR